MSLFLANRRRIGALVSALVPNAADADDVLQETSTRMWRNFDRFEPGTDFVAWAAAFVRFSVLTHYRRRRSAGRVTFNDELVAAVAEEAAAASEQVDARREALRECLQRLPEASRALIELRYEPGATIKSVAERLGRPIQGTYKAISRAHEALVACVERALARQAREERA